MRAAAAKVGIEKTHSVIGRILKMRFTWGQSIIHKLLIRTYLIRFSISVTRMPEVRIELEHMKVKSRNQSLQTTRYQRLKRNTTTHISRQNMLMG